MTFKKVSVKEFSVVHMAFKELLRLSDGLANGSFCRLNILRVQLNPTEQLVKGCYPLIKKQSENGG